MFRLYRHAGIVFLVVCSTLYLVAGGVEAFPPPQAPEYKLIAPPGLLNTYSPSQKTQTAPSPAGTSLRSPPSLLGTRPVAESGGAVTDDSAEVLRPVAVQTSRPTSSGIPTGGDNCNETTPNAVAVPGAISIFGDNSAATGPDDCTGFNMGTIWWESFTITQCADVEITFCGSNPKIPSNWIFVTESCSADGSTCFGLFGASAANRAVCADENIWMLIEGLPAGTYYYPIISSTTSNYQMNITTFECSGACCNSTARTCSDNVLESNCQGVDEQLFASETCASSGCTGACCNQTAGTCSDNVFAIDCADTFFGGELCCTVECRDPAGPEYDASGVKFLSRVSLADFSADFGSTHGNASEMWGYTSPSGREYAIIALDLATAFVEVTNPLAPVIVAQIPSASSSTKDVKTFGQFALAVIDFVGPGLQIIDLSLIDSGTVTLVSTANPGGFFTAHNVVVNEDSGFAYIVATDVNFGFTALDMTNPLAPVAVGDWTEASVHDMQVVSYTSGIYAGREIAFVCAPFNAIGFWIVDVTDKNNMFTRGTIAYPNASIGHQGWLTEDRKYFIFGDEGDENNFGVPTTTYVIDVQDLDAPFIHTTFTNGGCTVDHNQIVHGDNVYQANYETGLRIWNLADIDNINEVGHFDTHPEDNAANFEGAWGTYPLLPSGIVLVSDRQRGLFVLDVDQAITGACCTGPAGICTNDVIADNCAGVFFKGSDCADVPCGPCPNQPSDFDGGSGSDLNAGINPNLHADDFVLGAGEQIDVLRFWGNYATNVPLALDRFTVVFYEDDGFGLPGAEINRRTGIEADTRFTTGNILSGRDEYEYELILQPNKLIGPGRFWVAIYADSIGDPNFWIWNSGTVDPVHGIPLAVISFTFPEPPWFPFLEDFAFEILCKPTVFPKFSQLPKGNGEDIPSNIDWIDNDPNIVVADDWVSDGRVVSAVRWWGSLLDPTCEIVNGGFETGSFPDWVATSGANPFCAWDVTGAPGSCWFVTSPLSGAFDAWNGFDGGAGLVYEMYQEVSLPPCETITLSTNHRIQFDSLGIPSTLPRELDISIRDNGNAVLSSLYHEDVLLNGQPATDLGWNNQVFDISAFAGKTVRVHFNEFIPESFTGPGTIEFDDISITCAGAGQATETISLFDRQDQVAVAPQMNSETESYEEMREAYLARREQRMPVPTRTAVLRDPSPTPSGGSGVVAESLNELRLVDLEDFVSDGAAPTLRRSDVASVAAEDSAVQTPLPTEEQIDGWFISFHEPVEPGTPPAVPLGLYYCDAPDVNQACTGLPACDGHPVIEYFVTLDKCCLVHANPDSRSVLPVLPATKGAFLEERCFDYAIDIQAVIGHKFTQDPVTLECIEAPTGNQAVGDYWGWHTTDIECGAGFVPALQPALMTSVTMVGLDWLYGPWTPVLPVCSQPNMAFELLTTEPPFTEDANGNCVPDVCDCPPSAQPISTLVDTGFGIGNRTLVLETAAVDAGRIQGIRVVFTSLDPPYDIWNGEELWVQVPSKRCENANEVFPPCPGGVSNEFWVAELGCTPFFTDWSSLGGPIHAYHEGVVPGSLYTVDVIDVVCNLADKNNFSPPLNMATSRFGDVCTFFSGVDWPPPDGGVDVVADTIAVLSKFSDNPTAPISSRADLEPRNIDWKVTIADVLRTVNAFAGDPYPFVPSVGDPCP